MEGITIQVSEHSELQNIVNQVAQSKEPVSINFVFQNITFVVQSQLVGINPPKQKSVSHTS